MIGPLPRLENPREFPEIQTTVASRNLTVPSSSLLPFFPRTRFSGGVDTAEVLRDAAGSPVARARPRRVHDLHGFVAGDRPRVDDGGQRALPLELPHPGLHAVQGARAGADACVRAAALYCLFLSIPRTVTERLPVGDISTVVVERDVLKSLRWWDTNLLDTAGLVLSQFKPLH